MAAPVKKVKQFDCKFPRERIRKILQSNDDVGKIARATPFAISLALEVFLSGLIQKMALVAGDHDVDVLTTAHVKELIERESIYDFLRPLVAEIKAVDRAEEAKATARKRAAKAAGPRKRKPKQSSAAADGSDEDGDGHASGESDEPARKKQKVEAIEPEPEAVDMAEALRAERAVEGLLKADDGEDDENFD
eukprot:c13405_g1_i1.p1 GENE.c13405_g1_i1~~c13405_g1_i1.p1  ORF type:complete len:207 (+),score=35.48 c13405_g1_i1:48-623(+)